MEACSPLDIPCWFDWLLLEIQYLITNAADSVLQVFAGIIAAFPVPDFLLNVGSYSLAPSILYFTNMFEVPAGLAIMVTAYTLRFTIRRLPVVG